MWVYQNGVYKPNGREIIEAIAQKHLEEKTQDRRIRETISYIERHTRTELPNPSTEYINLKNGRLYWRTNRLEPHDPKNFDMSFGTDICRNRIADKLWGHMGFVLQWAMNGLKGNN